MTWETGLMLPPAWIEVTAVHAPRHRPTGMTAPRYHRDAFGQDL
jgi:hypothetical protein